MLNTYFTVVILGAVPKSNRSSIKDVFIASGNLVGSVGYFKASNTGSNDKFSGIVALSAAGNT